MIDPKELRIGNLIIDKVAMRECVLCGITNIDAHYMFNGFRHIIGHEWFGENKGMLKASPIPITPEWLERLGFERKGEPDTRGYYSWVHKSGWCLIDAITSGVFAGEYIWSYIHPMGSLRMHNIHQLQNLYFALTGTELTIKQ